MNQSLHQIENDSAGPGTELAQLLARGICRALADHGLATLTEFMLNSGRRVDVIGLDRGGQTTIVEIKTSVADLRADQKWPEYLDYCDQFYFAVPEAFPREWLPGNYGLMVADAYGAVILRQSSELRLNPARRRAQHIRFAVVAAERLGRMIDPR